MSNACPIYWNGDDMPITVTLPATFDLTTMYSVIDATIDDQLRPRSSHINYDFSRLAWAAPDGMTVLSNLIEWLRKREVRGSFIGCSAEKRAHQYMDDCGFFEEYSTGPLRKRNAMRSTTQQIRKVACSGSVEWLNQLMPWLADDCIGTTKGTLAEFKTSLREIFLNIEDHSTEEIGCVHVQWFPNGGYVHLSISDFGVGIPTEIGRVYETNSDAHALAISVREGISSKRNGRNRGAGLAYLIDNAVGRYGGRVAIHSNRGKLECSQSSGKLEKKPVRLKGYYPGTLISIVLLPDRIRRIDDEREDFEW
jgi:hypothetical protein